MATSAQLQTGLRLVSALLITLVVLYVLSFLLSLFTSGFNLIGAAQTAFMIWVCWCCYIGRVWARLLLAVLLVIFGVAAVVGGLHLPGGLGTAVTVLGALEIAGAVMLFAVPQVNAYFEYAAAQG